MTEKYDEINAAFISDFQSTNPDLKQEHKIALRKITKTPKGNEFVVVAKSKREEQKLSGTQIVELAKICANIEWA